MRRGGGINLLYMEAGLLRSSLSLEKGHVVRIEHNGHFLTKYANLFLGGLCLGTYSISWRTPCFEESPMWKGRLQLEAMELDVEALA